MSLERAAVRIFFNLQSLIFFLLSSFFILQLTVSSNTLGVMAEHINGATVLENNCSHSEEMLFDALHRLISMIIFPDACKSPSTPLLQRIKISVSENGPRLTEASRNSGLAVLRWTRGGSPLRSLLVISVRVFLFFS